MSASELKIDLAHFPHKQNVKFLGYCSVSPLNTPAMERAQHALVRQNAIGRGMLFEYPGDENIARRFHRNFGQLMKTSPENITMLTNTSEGISMIANGYPFQAGDQIISYVNEYPANHYPWVLQAKHRGVELIQLGDVDVPQQSRDYTAPISEKYARGWSFEELESKVTAKTRIVAISHVQFHSGFAADLAKLGDFCQSKGIDLVVDAAQSLGCLPVYPEAFGVSCVAAAGWKWLLGPVGSGVMYTSPEFRDKIRITMSGADHMKQDTEYLDHTWAPHPCGRKFEYSTVSYSLLDGLSVGLETIFLPNSPESIRDYVYSMHELLLEHLDMDKYQPVVHVPEHRSGILSLIPKVASAKMISNLLDQENIVITPRDGYLRVGPHLCTTEDEILAAAEALNRVR